MATTTVPSTSTRRRASRAVGVEHVLAVVEDQQAAAAFEVEGDGVGHVHARLLAGADRVRHRRRDLLAGHPPRRDRRTTRRRRSARRPRPRSRPPGGSSRCRPGRPGSRADASRSARRAPSPRRRGRRSSSPPPPDSSARSSADRSGRVSPPPPGTSRTNSRSGPTPASRCRPASRKGSSGQRRRGGGRADDLVAVGRGHHPGRPVHRGTQVIVAGRGHDAGVQSHPDPQTARATASLVPQALPRADRGRQPAGGGRERRAHAVPDLLEHDPAGGRRPPHAGSRRGAAPPRACRADRPPTGPTTTRCR